MADLQSQIADLQKQLAKVNRESADRRRQLKQIQEQTTQTSGGDELAAAREELAKLRPALVRYQLKDAFVEAARDTGIAWVTDQAQEDAFALAQAKLLEEALGDEGIDMDAVKRVLKDVLKPRTHLVKAATKTTKPTPETDAEKRNEQAPAVTPEQIAAQKRASLGSPI